MRILSVWFFMLFFAATLSAQELKLEPADLVIKNSPDSGFDLYIRKKPDIKSVMLVESTEDPDRKIASYALRNPVFNPINGNEQRLLDGKPVSVEYGYHIVDSSVEPHPELGEAFHLFVPWIANYGYPWGRNGEVMILEGTYLNVRTFEKPYCDYTGKFYDNPYIVRVVQEPSEIIPETPVETPVEIIPAVVPEAIPESFQDSPPESPPEGNYRKEAVEAFSDISEKGNGELVYSSGEDDIVEKIDRLLSETGGDSLDLVLALDATDSMKNDMPALKTKLPPLVESYVSRFKRFRIGMVYYRDYFDEFLFQRIPFETTTKRFNESIQKVVVRGGQDIPEAVFEALYAGVTTFEWEAETRLIILIGDAPPHPRPRGKITEDMVYDEAEARNIKIYTIILPQ